MFPTPDSDHVREGDVLADRVEALAAWLQELDARLRAAEVATGDEKTAKELRKAIQALAKHDPKLEDRLKDRVDVVNDRLAMLAETVATTSAALAAKDGEIVGLRRALEAGQARIESLASDLRTAPSPTGLEELRKEIAALSVEPRASSPTGLAEKVEAVQQRLDMLHETVSTTAAGLASRDGDLASLRRQLEEDVHKVADAVAELRIAKDPVHVGELRLSVKELTEQMAALEHRSGEGLGNVTNGLQSVSARLDSLAQALAGTGEALAAREAELETLRTTLGEETGRLDSHVTRIEQVLAETTSQLERVEGLAERETVEALDERVQGFSEGLDAVSGRLAALSRAVEETGQGADERAGALSQALTELSQSFEQEKAGFARLLSEIRSEVRTLAEAGPGEELEARLQGLSQQVEGIGHRLHDLDTLSAGAREEASGVRAELARGLEQVAQRIEAVERERAAAAHELAQALAASAEERESLAAGSRLLEERVQGFSEGLDGVSGRLAALSRAVEETGQGYEERRQEVGALRTEFDEETGRLDSHVTKIEQVLTEVTEKLSLLETSFGPDPAIVTRVEVLAQAVEAQAAAVAAATDGVESGGREIADLRAKTHEGERRLESVAAGLRGALDALAGQLDSVAQRVELSTAAARMGEDARLEGLDARVEQTGARVDALAAELRQAVDALSSRQADQDVADRYATLERRLETLAADLDAKSASKETDLMLGKILLRVDEVTQRLEELEQSGGTAPARHLGDLELRIEQAEEAARENRESVLVQLERLASRVEYRLDRLEAEPPTPASQPQPETEGPHARVVPIRGNEA